MEDRLDTSLQNLLKAQASEPQILQLDVAWSYAPLGVLYFTIEILTRLAQ